MSFYHNLSTCQLCKIIIWLTACLNDCITYLCLTSTHALLWVTFINHYSSCPIWNLVHCLYYQNPMIIIACYHTSLQLKNSLIFVALIIGYIIMIIFYIMSARKLIFHLKCYHRRLIIRYPQCYHRAYQQPSSNEHCYS